MPQSLALNLKKTACLSLSIALACLVGIRVSAQTTAQVITLDPPDGRDLQTQTASRSGQPLPALPANFHRFGDATVGEPSDLHKLTLRFSASTQLTHIASTPDFQIEQGGSCAEGRAYRAKDICTFLVRFVPQGAGKRLGHLTISHTGSQTAMSIGLLGTGYSPVVSFTPSIITTVPGTYVAGAGLLSETQSLTVDGGDTLYIADTGHNVIRTMDSSGTIETLPNHSGSIAPVGIAVDSIGDIFFSDPDTNGIYVFAHDNAQLRLSGEGTDPCPLSANCLLSQEWVTTPEQMAIDSDDRLFFSEFGLGAAVSTVQPSPATFARLYDQVTQQGVISVDASDNIYSAVEFPGNLICEITEHSFEDAQNYRGVYKKVAGGSTCGFSGDGGQARNAEIGNEIGQFAFDVAGNLYFTDSDNQRVRRIDSATGIISTIAGNGTADYSGDGGPATSATLLNPSGVTVDSQGQVYVVSYVPGGPTQVVRKVGTVGLLSFGSQTNGVSSSDKAITVANTGNQDLTFVKTTISGRNASDFKIDKNSSNCGLSSGSVLPQGKSCKVAVTFKPSGSGTRTASLVFEDNSIPGSNIVELTGAGTLRQPTVTITSPCSGASFKKGSTIKVGIKVASSSSPKPTGKVTLKVDGSIHGGPVTLSSGEASINLSGLGIGNHTLSVNYSGDSNYSSGASVSKSFKVVK